jgi:hypothetical protein
VGEDTAELESAFRAAAEEDAYVSGSVTRVEAGNVAGTAHIVG